MMCEEPGASPPITARDAAMLVAAFLLAFAFTVGLQGVSTAPLGAALDSLPVLLQQRGLAAFPGDLYVETCGRLPSVFWWVLGLLPGIGEPRNLWFALLPLLAHGMFIAGVGAVAWTLAATERRCGAAALAMLAGGGMGDALLGANYLLQPALVPTTMVAGPLLFALAWALRGGVAGPMVLVGLLATVHVLNAVYAGAWVAAVVAMRAWNDRGLWRRALVGAVAATAGIVSTGLAGGGGGGAPSGWGEQLIATHSIHFLSGWFHWADGLRTLAVAAVILAAARCWNEARGRGLTLSVGLWLGEFVLLGWALADGLLWRPVLLLQPLRATAWLLPVALALVAARALAPEDSHTGHGAPRILWWGVLWCLLLFQLLRPFRALLAEHGTGLLAAQAVLLWLPPSFWSRSWAVPVARGVATFLPLWCAFLVLLRYLSELGFATAGFIQPGVMPLLLLGWCGVAAWWRDRGAPLRSSAVVTVAMLLVMGGYTVSERVLDGRFLMASKPDREWEAACAWLRKNTAPDAVLQGPPSVGGMRWFARRAVFFEKDDDHALFLDPAALRWYREREELLGGEAIIKYGGGEWSAAGVDWRRLRWRHRVDWLLLREPLDSLGDPAFRAGEWRVYELPGGDAGDR